MVNRCWCRFGLKTSKDVKKSTPEQGMMMLLVLITPLIKATLDFKSIFDGVFRAGLSQQHFRLNAQLYALRHFLAKSSALPFSFADAAEYWLYFAQINQKEQQLAQPPLHLFNNNEHDLRNVRG